jgi:acylphosphatase
MKSRLHIKVYGDVQGVFFRANTQSQAQKLGVFGWVRNVNDGSVEVLAEGEHEKLQKLLDWCQHGPAGASVSKVDFEWQVNMDEFSDFRVTYG